MVVGFTGTRKGMTEKQKSELKWVIFEYLQYSAIKEVHHGDCVGADSEFHHVMQDLTVVIHPPEDDRYRANCRGNIILEPKPYLERNHDIVDACDVLIATPEGPEKQRSGTWATIRYARKLGKHIVIVDPEGRPTGENADEYLKTRQS